MQHNMIKQEEQTCLLQENLQQFIEEISALRSLAEVAGVTGHLLEDLDDFKRQVKHLDASEWNQKQVRELKRNELARLSLVVLRNSYLEAS
jgi:hypothetical protein